jgi:hypothetical protein
MKVVLILVATLAAIPSAAAEPGDISLQDFWARGPGDLPEGTVFAKVAKVKIREVRRCYRAALKVDRALVGNVLVRFELDRSARPSAVEVDAPTADLASCVAARVKRWRFAVPTEDGKSSTMSFHFRFELG